MPRILWLLPLTALLAGCVFTDCDFGDIDTVEARGLLTADGASLGDTLTVAFVSTPSFDVPPLAARGPYERTPDRSVGQTLELAYQVDGIDFGVEGRTARSLASTLRGDTLFVYIEGTLSPDRFTEVCSPPVPYLDVLVESVRAPVQVRAVRFSHTYIDELALETAAALRRADADRPHTMFFASALLASSSQPQA